MRPDDFRKLLRQEHFEPIQVGLSDGRCVIVRHPDQVVVAERHLLVGLARIERSKPLATPRSGDAIAKDWLIVNLLQIASVEPGNGGWHVRRYADMFIEIVQRLTTWPRRAVAMPPVALQGDENGKTARRMGIHGA